MGDGGSGGMGGGGVRIPCPSSVSAHPQINAIEQNRYMI